MRAERERQDKQQMAIISTTKLLPGMVLKSAVKDITGRLLLGEGVEISEKHINIVKAWGIFEVDIAGEVTDEAVQVGEIEIDDETRRKVEKELQELFVFTDLSNSSITKEIFRLSFQHKVDRLKGKSWE